MDKNTVNNTLVNGIMMLVRGDVHVDPDDDQILIETFSSKQEHHSSDSK
jgi:hypothetical protein